MIPMQMLNCCSILTSKQHQNPFARHVPGRQHEPSHTIKPYERDASLRTGVGSSISLSTLEVGEVTHFSFVNPMIKAGGTDD